MGPNLTINSSKIGQNSKDIVIKFEGDFDKAGYDMISDPLKQAIKDFDGKNLVFDFTRLKFINSEGIGHLMEIHTHLIKEDKALIVVGLSDYIADVFETIGMNDIMPIFDNLDDYKNKNG